MGKRLLSTLLAVCMVLSLASTAFATGQYGGADYGTGEYAYAGYWSGDTFQVGAKLYSENSETPFTLEIFPSNLADNSVYSVTSSGTNKIELERTYVTSGASGTHAGIPEEDAIKVARWRVKANDNRTLQLYPQIMGTVKFDDSIRNTTDTNTSASTIWYINGENEMPYTDVDLDLGKVGDENSTKQTELPTPASEGLKQYYEFDGWYTAPQNADGTASGTKITDVSKLADLCIANDSLSVTLYAHYNHIHTWKYDTASLAFAANGTGKAYFYCTATYDAFNQCTYKLADEDITKSSLYVTITANNVSYTGAAYDTGNPKNYSAVWSKSQDELKAIDSRLELNEKWTFRNNEVINLDSAPTAIGTYGLTYDPFDQKEFVTKSDNTDYTISFSITAGVQTATVDMSSYNYGETPTTGKPTYANGELDNTETSAEKIKYYYSANYVAGSAVDVSDTTTWKVWDENKANTLDVGTYSMVLTIPATDNYAAYTSPVVTFEVKGQDITDVTAKVVYGDGQTEAEETITYDGNEYYVVVTPPTVEGVTFTVKYGKTADDCTLDASTKYKNANADGETNTVYYEISADGYNTYKSSKTFTIGKKTLTPTVGKIAKDYDGSNTATLNVTVPGVVDGESITITVPATYASEDVATDADGKTIEQDVTAYTNEANVKVGLNTLKSNYEFDWSNFESLKGTIKKRTAVFSWGETNLPYTGNEHTVHATMDNLVDGDEVTLNYRNEKVSDKTYAEKATEVGEYYSQVESITGTDSVNYKILSASNSKTKYNISYITGVKAIISGTKTPENNTWYKSDVTLTAPTGYLITRDGENVANRKWTEFITMTEEGADKTDSYYLKRISDGALTERKDITSFDDINIDKTAPSVTIKFRTNEFKTKLNDITFGLFYKKNVDVTIEATDDTETLQGEQVSGVKTIEYQKVANASDYDEDGTWTTGDSLSVKPNEKFIIYARVTDNAGNVRIVCSNGTVVYTDSTKSDSVEYIRLSKEDKQTKININDNTIFSMKLNGASVATTEMTDGTHYSLNGKTIVLKGTYLETLPVGEYTIEVEYNPYDETYQNITGNDAPEKSIINLTVKKNSHLDAPTELKVVDTATTTSSITLSVAQNADNIHTETVNGTVEQFEVIEYSRDGVNWQTSPVFNNLSSGTTYTFYARYAETDNFYASTEPATVTGTTIAVKRSSSRGGGSSATYYTLTVTAGAGGTADVGKISVRSGSTKTINFTPSEGYVVADVVVNNTSVGARTAYTLTNITKNTTVKVTFVKSGNAVVVPTTSVINPSTGAGI